MHSNAVTLIPKLSLRRDSKIECSTVSKVALRSSRTNRTTSWQFMAISISLGTVSIDDEWDDDDLPEVAQAT